MSSSFKGDHAWAIRGIPEDIRRQVVERARAEGRTVGAWVSDALRRALEDGDLHTQLADLRRRIETLESGRD